MSAPASSAPARQATKQRAARDILMQVVVRVANLALGVVVTALVVRTLGKAGYGQWSTLFVVVGLIGYFNNFGMEGVAVREAAREPEQEHEWIGSVMLLRLMVLVPVMAAALAAVVALHESQQMLIAGLIVVFAMPFGGIGALGLLFQLRVDNRVPMIVLTLRSILWGAAVAVIYLRGGSMVALAIALVSTNAVGSLVQTLAAVRLGARWPRPSRARMGQLLRVGLPVGVAGALVMAYANIDQVIVFTISGSRQAGLYGAVYSIVDRAHFVPISIITTLAPVMAAAWPADRERLLRTAQMTAELLATASFGALAFACVAADPLVRLFFGAEFASAAPALPVLGGAFVLICFGYLNDSLLLVVGLQRRMLRISIVALVVNVAGNLVLVPLLGFMGAAWMTLVTEAVVYLQALRLLMGGLEIRRPPLGRVGRAAAAAVLLAAALGVLRLAHAPLAALVALACVCYPALLYVLGAVGREDVLIVLRRGSTA